MEHLKVSSSNIESVAYDEVSKTLEVKFKNGNLYNYEDVPSEKVADMLKADSIGKYFHSQIKNIHKSNKL